ncbi:MAG: twin-arginine translocase subunit TatC [Gammaproteobacteria bacterium]|nr:MAG: twin-arginine translocase subunit TatC [Gammaproteobacteria bacterium]
MSNTDQNETQQPFIEHLLELRSRLLKAVLAVLIVFCSLYYFANDFYSMLSEPLRKFLPEGSTMIATEVASPFLTPLKLSLVLSIFIAIPYVLYQAWSFIAPGLYRHEKVFAIPMLVSSVILFYLGAIFAYFVVFPLVFGFLTSVAPEGVTVMTDISSYLNFVLKLLLAFGLAFEIPIATLLMLKIGITSVAALKQKRPYIIVACFVIGMLLTPPDMISQTLLAVPMWLLFEIGILFGPLVEPKESSA